MEASLARAEAMDLGMVWGALKAGRRIAVLNTGGGLSVP